MKQPFTVTSIQKNLTLTAASLLAMILAAGCSTIEVVDSQNMTNDKLPRPQTIWVCDFVANPADIPAEAYTAGKTSEPSKPPTQEEIQTGQQLGKTIAAELTAQINKMGLQAEQATSSSKLQLNDVVIRGYLYTVDPGNAAERIFIGFGYGASILNTFVEGYQETNGGLKELGSANINAAGGVMPGGGATSVASFIIFGNPIAFIIGPAIKGVQELIGGPTIEGRAKDTATKIADELKIKFQEQGWISQESEE